MSSEAWARLVQQNDTIKSPTEISKDTFTIGRSPDCDLSFPDNKLISQKHCTICKEDDGKSYLIDTSTNGTLVDGSRIKQSKVLLKDGDEIHVVFKKNNVENNIAFVYEEITKPNLLEFTQEYDDTDDDVILLAGEPSIKRLKMDRKEDPLRDQANKTENKKNEEIEEILICSICQEILHDCVSLQPCLHSFCAGCLSDWLKTGSKSCPTCRNSATSVAQNHIIRNLTEIYLKNNPDKRRPGDVLEGLNKANIIKQQIMSLSGRHAGVIISEDEEDDDDSDDDDAYVVDYTGALPTFQTSSASFLPVCRECPGYDQRMFAFNPGALTTINSAVTDTSSTTPAASQCSPGQAHLVCFCCVRPFPDRRDTQNTTVACVVCSGIFCGLYWRCEKPSCRGCLAALKDHNFDHAMLGNILLNNPTESSILSEYLQSKSMTIKDMVLASCLLLDQGEFQLNNDFSCNFLGRNIRGDSIVCHRCGEKALRQLAYFYRKKIPNTDLPEAVVNKEDCYWGKNCRSQNRPHHAQKLNHICEQTRFQR